jgi:hypothetical protein
VAATVAPTASLTQGRPIGARFVRPLDSVSSNCRQSIRCGFDNQLAFARRPLTVVPSCICGTSHGSAHLAGSRCRYETLPPRRSVHLTRSGCFRKAERERGESDRRSRLRVPGDGRLLAGLQPVRRPRRYLRARCPAKSRYDVRTYRSGDERHASRADALAVVPSSTASERSRSARCTAKNAPLVLGRGSALRLRRTPVVFFFRVGLPFTCSNQLP